MRRLLQRSGLQRLRLPRRMRWRNSGKCYPSIRFQDSERVSPPFPGPVQHLAADRTLSPASVHPLLRPLLPPLPQPAHSGTLRHCSLYKRPGLRVPFLQYMLSILLSTGSSAGSAWLSPMPGLLRQSQTAWHSDPKLLPLHKRFGILPGHPASTFQPRYLLPRSLLLQEQHPRKCGPQLLPGPEPHSAGHHMPR